MTDRCCSRSGAQVAELRRNSAARRASRAGQDENRPFHVGGETQRNGTADLLVASQSQIKQADVIWNGQAPTT